MKKKLSPSQIALLKVLESSPASREQLKSSARCTTVQALETCGLIFLESGQGLLRITAAGANALETGSYVVPNMPSAGERGRPRIVSEKRKACHYRLTMSEELRTAIDECCEINDNMSVAEFFRQSSIDLLKASETEQVAFEENSNGRSGFPLNMTPALKDSVYGFCERSSVPLAVFFRVAAWRFIGLLKAKKNERF